MSGKSTFLNLISGIQRFDLEGAAVSICGRRVKQVGQLQVHSILLSNADDMFPDLSIWDNIQIALPVSREREARKQKDICVRFLEKSGIFSGKGTNRALGDLSTGGRVFVKLCRAIAASHPIVVVDELTSYLDDKRASYFLDKIVQLIVQGAAVVLVSHSERDRSYLVKELAKSNVPVNQAAILRHENVSEFVNEG